MRVSSVQHHVTEQSRSMYLHESTCTSVSTQHGTDMVEEAESGEVTQGPGEKATMCCKA